MTKALIIGGGIGGPVAAVALQRAGIEAVVYEAHPAPADALGAFLSLAPNGLAALHTVGMADAARRAASFSTTHIEFVNGSGRRLGLLNDGSQNGPDEVRTVTINRGALQRALAESAAAQGIHIEYNKRLTNYTTTDTGVTAEFSDGTTAEGDTLLGCDGIHSLVRRTMDPHAPGPVYTGFLGIGGYASGLDIADTPQATMRMVFGSRAFFGYQAAPSGEVYWFANLGNPEMSDAEITAHSDDTWKDHALELFVGDLGDLTTIMRASEPGCFRPLGTYDMATLPHWSRGRVAVMGDAAHAVSPSSGQGASMAIEDALVLAKCLRDVPLPQALATYEQQRRSRVERIVAEGRRRGNHKSGSSNRAALLMRDMTMRVMFSFIARFGSQAWIHDHRIDFDAPVVDPVLGSRA